MARNHMAGPVSSSAVVLPHFQALELPKLVKRGALGCSHMKMFQYFCVVLMESPILWGRPGPALWCGSILNL